MKLRRDVNAVLYGDLLTFLDACAGEGLSMAGIDADKVYLSLYGGIPPDEVRADLASPSTPEPAAASEAVGTVESAVRGAGGFHVRLAAGAAMPAVGTKLYAAPTSGGESVDAVLRGVDELLREAYAHWDADREYKVGKILLALIGYNKGYDKRSDAWVAALQATPSQAGKGEA